MLSSSSRRPPPWIWLVLLLLSLGGLGGWLAGCSGWDPSEPFERNAPDVDRAIDLMDGGQHQSAAEVLESYLGTGPCGDAGIGLPPAVRDKHNGSFDLGLALFHLAEKYGRRFGEEELADAGPEQEELDAKRSLEIDCAQIITKAIANDPNVPSDLRARAFYLSGNLEFLRKEYEAAVDQYDKALEIVPGLYPEAGGDAIGRDAAWNRAIALRRIQEQDAGQPDAEPDAEPDAQPDAPPDAEPDSGDDGGDDGGGDDAGNDGGDGDAGQDAGPDGGQPDAGQDGGDEQQEPPPSPDDQEPPPEQSDSKQIERLLDELEEAPTYQEEDAKRRAARARRRRVMEDK